MKNLLVALGLCCAMLFIPTGSLATSGACSGHGGVNCSAGADSDGSVICNDGWENSSVSYSSMVMCGSSHSTPEPHSVYTAPVTPVICPMHASPDASGECSCDTGYELSVSGHSCQIITCTSHATLIGNSCYCDNGYVNKDGVCLSNTQVCQAAFGAFAYSVESADGTSQCRCVSGYQWNQSSNSCVEIIQKRTLNPKSATRYFTGSPKSTTDLLNCLIVGDIKAKKYYLRGSKLIKTMSIQGKYCANDEDVFKKSNYKKGK